MNTTETVTIDQITGAVPGKINGHCFECDTFAVLFAGFLCADCTDPEVTPYSNGLVVNDNGYTGLAVTHPANELGILVTQEKKFGQFTAWWSDSITILARGSEERCVAVAKSIVRRPRG